MEAINQDIISFLAYIVLMICYGITLCYWIYLGKTLKLAVKYMIFAVIVFVGCAKTQMFYDGKNVFDVWFLLHPIICLLMIMILSGYQVHIHRGYSNQRNTLRDVFNGDPCRPNYNAKKTLIKKNESPTHFAFRAIFLVVMIMTVVYVFYQIGDRRDQSKTAQVLQQNERLKDEVVENQKKQDSLIQENEQEQQTSRTILEHALTKKKVRLIVEEGEESEN